MIILDSSFLIAFKISNDVHNTEATGLMKRIAEGELGKPLITDYIFDETITAVFTRSKRLDIATEFGVELLRSLELVTTGEETFQNTWVNFCAQRKSTLSFTDCATLATMKERDVTYIATFDRDFQHNKGVVAVGPTG